jgi:hypothetical protein
MNKKYTSLRRHAAELKRIQRSESSSSHEGPLEFFHDTFGNQGVGKLVDHLQLKNIFPSGSDLYEQEADRLAARMVDPSSDNLQLKSVSSPSPSVDHSALVNDKIQQFKSGGAALDLGTRSYFEGKMGVDLSQVRVHKDQSTARFAQSINARAFTLGNHIGFGSGQFNPQSRQGKELLAHELVHVVQQGKAGQKSLDRAEKDEAENYDGKLSAILLTAKKFVTVNGETVTFLKTKKEDRRYTIGRLVNYKNQTAIAVSQSSKPVQEFEKSSEWAKEISAKDEAERNDLIDNLARLDFKDRRQTILDDRGITYEEQKDSEKLAGYISILEAAHLPTTEYESLRTKAQKEETQNTDNKANTDTQQYRKELRLKLIATVIENYSGTEFDENSDLGRFDAEILHNPSLHVDPKLMGDLFEYWYRQQDGEIDREDLKGFDRSNPARTLARSKQIDFRDKSGKIVRKADGILKLADNNTLVEIKAVTGAPTTKHIDQMEDYAAVLQFVKKDWYHQKNGDIEKFKKMNMRYVFSTEKTALAWLPELLDKFDLIDGELQVYVGTRSLEINNNQKEDS